MSSSEQAGWCFVDSDQRAMRHMKLPERGILRVTGVHEGHSHSRISGVVTAPGIAPTRVEHKIDERGRVTMGQELPVLVDCADPSRFVILWDEAGNAPSAPSSFQYRPGADVLIGSEGQPFGAALPQDMAAQVEAALDQAFSQRGRAMPPGMAARVEQALDRALGQAGLQGQGISEAITQALGRASGQPYGAAGGPYGQGGAQAFDPAAGPSYGQGGAQPYSHGGAQAFDPAAGPSYGQGGAQPYGQGGGAQSYGQGGAQPYGQGDGAQPYGQGGAQPFDPAAGPSYGQGGQWGAQPYGQEATGFPQVSWTDQGGSGAGPQGGFNPAQPAQYPAGRGEPASAIVLAAQDVAPRPGFAAPGAAVDLTLEVRRADGSVYTTRTTLSVPNPEGRAALATPGARLSVLIDPNDPARVEIDPYGRF
jgi:hypothetical protein